MRKILSIILVSIVASLISGIYGMINDQITFTISPEYYTKFKFIQFNIANETNISKIKNVRFLVAIVGFLATWWFGLFLGFILGIIGIAHEDWKKMIKISFQSIIIALFITFTSGLIGFIYSRLILSHREISDFKNWFIPNNLIDFENFIIVGSIHNFSYFGGILGFIIAAIYSFTKKIHH